MNEILEGDAEVVVAILQPLLLKRLIPPFLEEGAEADRALIHLLSHNSLQLIVADVQVMVHGLKFFIHGNDCSLDKCDLSDGEMRIYS